MSSVAESLLDRLAYQAPKVINNSDYSSTYKIEDPLTKQGIEENPYVGGQELKMVTTRQSNELTDFRNSYIVYEDVIQYKLASGQNVNNWTFEFQKNPYVFPILAQGLPFSARIENVNGNVEISNCQNTFNRFSTLNIMCNHAGMESGTSHAPFAANAVVTGNQVCNTWNTNFDVTALSNPICGFVSVTPYGLVSNAYSDYLSTILDRCYYNRILGDDGLSVVKEFKRFQILPLEVVSRLASSPHLIPTGLMSQTSTYGWSLTLTLSANALQYVIPDNTPSPIADPAYAPIYRLTNPKLISKVIKIHDPIVAKTILDDFNFVPRQYPAGDDQVAEVWKNILIPFNNSSYHTDRVVAGTSNIKIRYSIEEKGLKGVSTRFSNDAMYSDVRVEKNVVDYLLDWKSVQWSIGSYKIPEDTINAFSRKLALYAQKPALHLFDPSNVYCEAYNPLNKLYQPFTGGAGSASFNSFLFSFENFAQDNAESVDTAHSFGVNTYLLGNVAILDIQLNSPLPSDISVESEFVFMDALLVGNGSIQRVFNKTVFNEPAQMK